MGVFEMSAKREKSLALLLKAPEKAVVNELFVYSFENRNSNDVETHGEEVARQLKVSEPEGEAVFVALKGLINECIYENYNAEEISKLFSSQFHKALNQLICRVISHHLPNWRKVVKGSQISLPTLEEFDWRVDIKSASDLIGQISVPTVLVAMKVNDSMNEKQPNEIVNFELSKESLSAMLEGLGKIRDQLNSVSSKSS